jgi:hypothetical protein
VLGPTLGPPPLTFKRSRIGEVGAGDTWRMQLGGGMYSGWSCNARNAATKRDRSTASLISCICFSGRAGTSAPPRGDVRRRCTRPPARHQSTRPDRLSTEITNERKHIDMATDTQQAGAEAADILHLHSTDPAIADILARLITVGEGEGEDAGLEEALSQIGVARESLTKDEGVSVAEAFVVGQKLAKAEAALKREYMTRHSVGFVKAEAAKAGANRLRARNFGRAA